MCCSDEYRAMPRPVFSRLGVRSQPLADVGVAHTDWSREGIALYLQEFVVSEKKEITTPQLAGKDMKVGCFAQLPSPVHH